jgi:hypothetical protein
MALRDLKTNLTDLRWGNDIPGGGDSGLPYIKISTPEKSTAIERIALESAKFSSDFPVRGGLYSVRAAAEDAIRIRKFLTDFPKGSNFTQKQVGLQKSNPLIETGKNGGRINTRTYNLNSNLLFSTLQAGTGNYYPRAGATPFTLLDDDNKYFSIVGKKSTKENRLFNLLDSKINKNIDSFKLENLGISSDDTQIMNYIGGPNSLYGDGETVIFRSTDHTGLPIDTSKPNTYPTSEYIPQANTGSLSILGPTFYLKNNNISDENLGIFYDEIITNNKSVIKPTENILNKERYIIGSTFNDFRKDILPSGSIFSRDYTNPKIFQERRIGVGSPGSRPRESRKNINIVYEPGQDKKNLTPIYYGDGRIEDDPDQRDLIKFAFETIDNDNINQTYRTHFRAYLKGFSDNNSAEWDNKKYAGRGDKMYSYQGFDRSISFSFTVLAHSKQEMKPLWQKLNYLNSTLQPDYNPNNGFMRGNIHKLTIGEYLYRMPGIITSLNFSIQDQYSWEIKMNEPEQGNDEDMMELPHLIDVSVSFKPIFNELPRTITRTNQNIGALISNKVGNIENFINRENYIQNI